MTSSEAERALRVLEWLGSTHQGYWGKGMRKDFEATATLLERIIVERVKK